MARTAPKVLSIPAGLPFLPTLADALLAGRFGPLGDDPLALADVTIFLVVLLPAIVLRIRVEERLLFEVPGYREYAHSRMRLVPGVW